MASADESAADALGYILLAVTKRRGLCSGNINLVRQALRNFLESREKSDLRDSVDQLVSQIGPKQYQSESPKSKFNWDSINFCPFLHCLEDIMWFVCRNINPRIKALVDFEKWSTDHRNASKAASCLLETLEAYALSLKNRYCTPLECTKVHEGLLEERLGNVKENMLMNQWISSKSLKLWVNAAALHGCLLFRMSRDGACNLDTVRNLAREYQEAIDELLAMYKAYRKRSARVYTIKGATAYYGIRLHDYESGKVSLEKTSPVELQCVESNARRIAEKYVDVLFESDISSQAERIRQFFEQLPTYQQRRLNRS